MSRKQRSLQMPCPELLLMSVDRIPGSCLCNMLTPSMHNDGKVVTQTQCTDQQRYLLTDVI